jgi:hypothetical protein
MCGRVAQKTPLGEIRALFETTNPVPNTGSTPGRIAWVHARLAVEVCRVPRGLAPTTPRDRQTGSDQHLGVGRHLDIDSMPRGGSEFAL